MKLRATVRRMLSMCPGAWYIFMGGIQLSCALLACALLLLLTLSGDAAAGYARLMTARALAESTQALLLISGILSVCVEDMQR